MSKKGLLTKFIRKIVKVAKVFTMALLFVYIFGTPISCLVMKAVHGVEVLGPSWLIPNDFPIEARSIFHEMYLTEKKSAMRCSLVIKNHTRERKRFMIAAFTPLDVLGGFLSNPYAFPRDRNGHRLYFSLEPGETARYEDVFFEGDRGWGDAKLDRSLPMLVFRTYDEAEGDLVEAQKEKARSSTLPTVPTPVPGPH
jgi:hypothetical protein